jgi:hypothetical protein
VCLWGEVGALDVLEGRQGSFGSFLSSDFIFTSISHTTARSEFSWPVLLLCIFLSVSAALIKSASSRSYSY